MTDCLFIRTCPQLCLLMSPTSPSTTTPLHSPLSSLSKPSTMIALFLGPNKFTTPNDITLAYYIRGNPSGGLIVIQNIGWGLFYHHIARGLEHLESDFSLLSLEARGTGGSSRPPPRPPPDDSHDDDEGKYGGGRNHPCPNEFPNHVPHLECLRLHLHLDAFPILYGHSNAGSVVLAYAQFLPYADAEADCMLLPTSQYSTDTRRGIRCHEGEGSAVSRSAGNSGEIGGRK